MKYLGKYIPYLYYNILEITKINIDADKVRLKIDISNQLQL